MFRKKVVQKEICSERNLNKTRMNSMRNRIGNVSKESKQQEMMKLRKVNEKKKRVGY